MTSIPTNKKWIYHQYITLDKTMVQIAREFNCSIATIKNRLRMNNIHNKGYRISYDWIHHQYVILGKSIAQIAREFNCDKRTIRRKLNKYNILILGIKGNRNHNWKGDKAGYEAIHQYIARNKAKPEFCERCGKVPPKELSCNNHKYTRNIEDYEWLCVKCHFEKDGGVKHFFKM